MADFLVALARFDAHRGWEPLGHASLFAFLHVELKLSNSAAFHRMNGARLLQRFPQLVEPLADGRLCLSTTAELAKVLTEENHAQVAPRFFGLSAREAQELVAELQPRQVPATRVVVTRVEAPAAPSRSEPVVPQSFGGPPLLSLAARDQAHLDVVPLPQLLTSEVANGGGGRPQAPRDETEPLTADLRRLHITVSRQLLKKLEAARSGLGHAIPGATLDQVIDAAVDLLLDKQARARALVKRPRWTITASPTESSQPTPAPQQAPSSQPISALDTTALPILTEPPPHRRDAPRAAIPAAVKRAVWQRDAGRCSWPLDGGGCCGSTHRLELDHIVPWAKWGGETEADLRLVCAAHNRLAARQAFGERFMARYRGVRETVAEYGARDSG